MNYILDTNVCIQLIKGRLPSIKEKAQSISNHQILIPAIVRYELFVGAYKSPDREKAIKTVRHFISSFQTIPLSDEIAEKGAEIRANLESLGTPIGPYDILIAATAISAALTLVTNNVKEFSRVPRLNLEDWQA